MVSNASEPSMRVNGALLPMYTGQKVVLVGTVAQVDPSGSSLMVKASDGKMVMVTLPNPLQDNLEGVIEVHGVGQGQKVMCQSYITFPQMQADKFDAALYDEALKLIQSVRDNPWKPDIRPTFSSPWRAK
ncbi:replication protein A 14 kDa subunit-like isoform X2 [Scylla paramamosain]|uniref:replication protein A 14 kDa subunit-like isoform X2 n=1 Tax=Scylla paramamosain TaxID=85552 RepID=UPI0030834B08